MWIDWGLRSIKGYPNLTSHTRYNLKSDGSNFEGAFGLTHKSKNWSVMLEI